MELEKYYNSKEEIKLTKFIKIRPDKCNDYQPISVIIRTAANAFQRRQILRQTWVSDIKSRNISVYFSIGLTVNQTQQKFIEDEAIKYGDLIQFGFIDSYYNLTLKSIANLRWSENYCRTKHVLSLDDDLFVNIEPILTNLHNFKRGKFDF